MITYKDVMEFDTHQFSAFASDLYDVVPELQQGFPKTIKTNIGNKADLVAISKKINQDNDIMYVRYRQVWGCVDVIIYNT